MMTRLAVALRVPGSTLVYGVERIDEAVAAISAIDRDATVVILDDAIPDLVRERLIDLEGCERVVALTAASTPSPEMWALFPVRMAFARAFEEVH